MTEIGTVTKIKENGYAVVRFDRKASCDKCNMCMGKKNAHIDYTLENAANALAGDKVLVDLSMAALSLAACIAYVVPLLFAVAAFLLTRRLAEPVQLAVVLGSIVLSFAAAAILDAKYFKRRRLKPKMLSVVKTTDNIK